MFLPNVWFFGGTAFSDIPGLALLVAASATLLRSCRERNAYFAGALLLGLAAAIRPQALVVGCAPALIASWCRVKEKRAKDVFTASAIGIAVLAISYGGAALASQSVEGYVAMNGMLRQYVRNVDSFLNPDRPPVISLFPDFFVRAIPGGHIAMAISALAVISIIASLLRRTRGVWILVAMFLPFNIIGWFMLDTNSISRYSVGYAAMYAILAVDGIDALLLALTRRTSLLAVAALETMLVVASIASLFWWTLPALHDARHTVSPPVAAMEWIHATVPRSGRLYVRTNMQPFADYMLRGYDVTLIEDPSELPQRPVGASDWFVSEGSSAVVGAHNFVRDRGHLFDIARQRYFEVSIVPMTSVFRFGAGWYGGENVGLMSWRWMSGHSETLLPPVVGNARLTMGFDIPSEMVSRHPTIEIQINGHLVDRFVCSTPSVRKSWLVPARADAWNQLVISMDKVLNPAKGRHHPRLPRPRPRSDLVLLGPGWNAVIDLLAPPDPMTTRQKRALLIATLITAATRVWGLARSPWDWDEILFSLALRHYDVASHHPHPPGFPLFIAAAKLFTLMGVSDFHALQAVNLAAGVLLVPATFFFCRELRLSFSTSLIAALLLAFFPNVWFFGETAFSDVPSVVLVVFACGLLLRGCRSDSAFVGGAIALACAGAMRPQNLVIGFAPALIAAWFRVRQRRFTIVVAAVIALVTIVAVSFGIAALETGGWERYSEALRAHQQYITATDSFRNPNRPPLHHLLDDFFVRPYHAPLINVLVTVFVLLSLFVSLVRRRWPVLIAVAAFSPFCLAAWLVLDHFSASRFSIGYAPMIAMLAADGLALLSFRKAWIEWSAGLALAALMFVWTVPAIDLPRRSDSPPVQAMTWVRSHVDPKTSVIYAHESMGPYTEYFLAAYRVNWTLDGPAVARLDPSPAWYLREGSSSRAGSVNFAWPRGRRGTWRAAATSRSRSFRCEVRPVSVTAGTTRRTRAAGCGGGCQDTRRSSSRRSMARPGFVCACSFR